MYRKIEGGKSSVSLKPFDTFSRFKKLPTFATASVDKSKTLPGFAQGYAGHGREIGMRATFVI